ncbi:dTMP kinase [Fusobacterium varium]|uniref:dTMP kinase n=1 Tax=Fusobacterium varium TaxID=856 RepID=UPI00266BC3F2|nr:dTMP kinase [Fusobacterium varium]
MRKNKYSGLFVAFDGPNGVGKSTLIEYVQTDLVKKGINVWITKEPTNTQLGNFTRQIAETLESESLTCLVAADRYQHLGNEIIPNLKEKQVVLTDRYILSSLILQRMDNVDVDFILATNKNIILPDIQIVVTGDQDVIQARLNERERLTRFEQGKRTSEELHFLKEGAEILKNLGVEIIIIENSGDLSTNVSAIAKHIQKGVKQ